MTLFSETLNIKSVEFVNSNLQEKKEVKLSNHEHKVERKTIKLSIPAKIIGE